MLSHLLLLPPPPTPHLASDNSSLMFTRMRDELTWLAARSESRFQKILRSASSKRGSPWRPWPRVPSPVADIDTARSTTHGKEGGGGRPEARFCMLGASEIPSLPFFVFFLASAACIESLLNLPRRRRRRRRLLRSSSSRPLETERTSRFY